MAREQSAAGAGRTGAAEASLRAGSVEAAKEPEHLEGSLAHLTADQAWWTARTLWGGANAYGRAQTRLLTPARLVWLARTRLTRLPLVRRC